MRFSGCCMVQRVWGIEVWAQHRETETCSFQGADDGQEQRGRCRDAEVLKQQVEVLGLRASVLNRQADLCSVSILC
jgi:hypothetical protein